MFDSHFDEDAAGRFSDDRSGRLLKGVAVSRQAELAWSPDLVKRRLEEAAEGAERLSGRVGPRAKFTNGLIGNY